MADIQKLFEIASLPGAARIRVRKGDEEIEVDFGLAPAAATARPAAITPAPAAAAAGDDFIKAPLVGVFYGAPSPDAGPFVTVGQKVKKGDTLCIIEAMKLMNEIESTRDGVISVILAENGAIVEYGQPLFVIR